MPSLTATAPITDTIVAQFRKPHPQLQRYISTYYIADIESPDGTPITDLLHPEWASVRYICSGSIEGSVMPDMPSPIAKAGLVGPTSRACPIICSKARIVSFGLLPLGWHRFIGIAAHKYADFGGDLADIKSRTDFASVFPLLQKAESIDQVAAIFDDVLLNALSLYHADDEREEILIERGHFALLNPEIISVTDLADYMEMSVTQLERFSKRSFGFAPKLLMRRQRFLRTLATILINPNSKWTDSLDSHYHDQAHFNRDFRHFFGMSPSEYLATPKPIVGAAAQARLKALGDPLQGLQHPGVLAD